MQAEGEFVLGEYRRALDERFRLVLPAELIAALGGEQCDLILAKERPGCLSLWNAEAWQTRLTASVELVRAKMRAGKLEGRLGQVQSLGRLLSTRHRTIQFSGRGRILLQEGFREFLRVDPGGDVVVVGACVCVELWNPQAWLEYVERRMPQFRRLLDRLSE